MSPHERYNRQDWLAWKMIQEQALRQWKSHKSGGFDANVVDTKMGERTDLKICAVCALPAGVASAVGIQELDREPQERVCGCKR